MSEHTKINMKEEIEHQFHEAHGTGSDVITRGGGLSLRFPGYVGFLLLFVSMSACAPVISEGLRKEVASNLTLRDVSRDPDLYKGKIVLWSGTILEAQNTREGTLLKVLQKPADSEGKPKNVDESEGRFLALERRYLDPAISTPG